MKIINMNQYQPIRDEFTTVLQPITDVLITIRQPIRDVLITIRQPIRDEEAMELHCKKRIELMSSQL